MKLSQMTEGTRVVLTSPIIMSTSPIEFSLDLIIEAGATGTVCDLQDLDDCVALHVRLDDHIPELDEWDNLVQVGDREDSGCTPADWEIVP